jgi:multimeric flavodoxin WrbA
MEKVKILGIVGSPRKQGNTSKLVGKALEAAGAFPWVETDLFEVAGKKIGHCVSCYKCMEKGECVIRDGLQEFCAKWLAADGILWGVPVFHMSVPSAVKALLDRFGNAAIWQYLKQGREVPRFCKAVGVLTSGASRFGGQDLTLSYLVNSAILMKGIVVSGDTLSDSYLGAAAWTGQPPDMLAQDNVLKDEHGIACAQNVARRVAEMARIVKAGKAALGTELGSEYSYAPSWEAK